MWFEGKNKISIEDKEAEGWTQDMSCSAAVLEKQYAIPTAGGAAYCSASAALLTFASEGAPPLGLRSTDRSA